MNALGIALIAAGVGFMAVTSLGMARLPDFFARAHAVSKSETLGLALVLAGLIFYEGASLTSLKLGLIAVFVAIANPVAAHLLTRGALRAGEMPWMKEREE